MANLKYISSFIIFGQNRGIKWIVPSDFLAKKKQLSFYEGFWHIAASIKEGLLLLRSKIVIRNYGMLMFCKNRLILHPFLQNLTTQIAKMHIAWHNAQWNALTIPLTPC